LRKRKGAYPIPPLDEALIPMVLKKSVARKEKGVPAPEAKGWAAERQGRKRSRLPAEQRKSSILRAAAEVFAERGYRLSSVSEIVQRAGVARGTFYLYFDSKRDAFLQVVQTYFEDIAAILWDNHAVLEEALREGKDFLGAWRRNISSVLDYHRSNPHLASIVYREALGRDEDFSERVEELSRLARRIYREELRMMEDRGLIRPCDLELVTSMAVGGVVYVILEHLVQSKGADVEAMAEEILAYHARALAPRHLP